MDDVSQVTISCSRVAEIVSAKNAAVELLPPLLRDKLNRVFTDYLVRFGLEGAFERMNDRTITDIIQQYDASGADSPILKGRVEEIGFELYDGHSNEKPPTDCE